MRKDYKKIEKIKIIGLLMDWVLWIRERAMSRKILRFFALAFGWMVVMFRDTEGGADFKRKGIGEDSRRRKENFRFKDLEFG